MDSGLVFVLALVSCFALIGQNYVVPSEAAATDGSPVPTSATPITATTPGIPMKDTKVTASKDVKDAIKAAKEAKKARKDCMKDCGIEYDPVCVHDPADPMFKPRTFGSQCALEVHNCEMGTKLAVKSKGECSGSDGVNLSGFHG